MGWKEYNEADKFREIYENKGTPPSFHILIEAFDEKDISLLKIHLDDIKHTLTDYRKCVPLGNLDTSIHKYLEKITNF